MRKLAAAAIILTAVLTAGCGPQRTSELVLFASDRDGVGTNLYTMKLDTSAVEPVTNDLTYDYLPFADISPDGTTVVFVSDIDGDGEVYLCDIDGANRQKLTDNSFGEDRPSFTPDGRILFDSDRSGDWEVWIMNADGTGVVQLTDSPGIDESARMGPEGHRIVFVSERNGYRGLYLMETSGGEAAELWADGYSWVGDPSFHPAGDRIVFSSDYFGDKDVYVMDLVGGQPVNLTSDSYEYERFPRYSADGDRIVYASTWDWDWDIFVMDSDGTHKTQLTTNEEISDYLPVW